ncbi:exo-beta-N-acetylmuramidase NamZ domain-containing protein, partial [Parabacteroides goldsteinii]
VRGLTEEEIRESWQPELDKYKQMRKKYLLYPDYRSK